MKRSMRALPYQRTIDGADALRVPAQHLQGLGQQDGVRIVALVGNPARGDDGDARALDHDVEGLRVEASIYAQTIH